MSGVRVVDPSLRELGLTLPGFIERGEVIASLPSLGLLAIAAHTPPHWTVEYREIDALTDADLLSVAAGRFDLVAISSLTARISDAYRLADHLRNVGTQVVLGGLHATALPDEALGHVDAVVQGQGEAVWPALLDDFERGALRRVYTSIGNAGLAHRLEDSRVPRYDLLNPELYNRLPLQTTRGCPRDCVFCGSSRLLGPYQIKPIPMIRRELERILELWPRPFIELADDNTFIEKTWARELAALFAEHHVRWFTETDLTLAEDDRLLELLASSGCAQVLVGLESVTSPALQGIDSAGWKARQTASALDAVRRISPFYTKLRGDRCLTHVDREGPSTKRGLNSASVGARRSSLGFLPFWARMRLSRSRAHRQTWSALARVEVGRRRVARRGPTRRRSARRSHRGPVRSVSAQ